MDASRRGDKISDVFSAALEQAPGERDAFVRERCRDDTAVADEVLALLAIHERLEAADALLDEPADDFIGTTVGSYKVVRLLGKGGMGRVYLASRSDGSFQRDVAIKIIGDRFAHDLTSRFEQERRILAVLRHPHIATLFDAGVTAAGRMYLLMEYIDGPSLTDYCRERRLGLRARIELFTRVCDAVGYAHQNLVVHRDLKPGNILVDGRGEPKLLDFGIAKMLTTARRDPDPTDPARRRLTPAYASPELLSGGPTQTAMDVYALGIVLYELVTGERPSRPDERSTVLLRPSDCLQARLPELMVRQRREAGVMLPSQLRGDIDAIVEKALADDWQHRYQSAEALADDLRAWASHRPVAARHAGVLYRGGKLLRRNAALSTAATIAAIALLVAAGVLFQLWRQARDARDRAHARLEAVAGLATSLFEVDRGLARIDGATAARRSLADSLRHYLETFSQTDDRRVLLDAARAYQRLGDVEGNVNSSNLGRPDVAIAHYDRAIRILQRLAAGRQEPDVMIALARGLASRGDIHAGQSSWDAAEADYRAALTQLPETVSGAAATDVPLTASIHRALGDVYRQRRSPDVALTHYERALALDRQAARAGLAGDEVRRLEALTQVRLGDARRDLGSLTDARDHYERAVALLASLTGDLPRRDLQREAALGYARLGQAVRDAGADTGRAEFERAIGMLRGLAASDDADARARRDLVTTLFNYSDLLERVDRQRWRATLDEARVLARRDASEWPDDTEARRMLTAIEDRLARGGTVSLQLASVDAGKPIEAGEPLTVGQRLRAEANVPPGWSRYLLVFGADGPAEIFDEGRLASQAWTIEVRGPMPAQTVLLVASPMPLTPAQRDAVVRSVESTPEPRIVDVDSHIVWRDNTDRVESVAASRGKPEERRWTRTILQRVSALGGVRLSGRTFPLRVPLP